MKSTKISDWQGCYDDAWKGIITDAAFAHPAKFAHGLIRRIYQHALAAGHVQPGAVVLDPFGGVALGALYAMQNGLHWVGCELEEKFVSLGRENIALWNARYAASLPAWGSAMLLQGDSRRLASVVAGAGLVVGSPPFSGVVATQDPNFLTPGEQGKKVPSKSNLADYGSTPGQLAALPAGDVAAVIASPPFAGNTGGRGEASRNGIDSALFDRHSGGMKKGTGTNPANLDHLPQGDIAAVIGSPPYADGLGHDAGHPRLDATEDERRETEGSARRNGYRATPGQLAGMVVGSPPFENGTPHNGGAAVFIEKKRLFGDYGSTPGQLGTDSGPTFWHAAAEIMAQCALLLPVGGYAYWVVKAYVKKGEIVDFPGQWAALCEAYGFEVAETVRAWLVKDHGEQVDLFGNGHKKSVARKSFFRRLAEAKGSPAIDWETVLITRRRND